MQERYIMEYRKASIKDLEKIWDKDILDNPDDKNYLRWKHQYIENNQLGKCATFVAVDNTTPIAQITVLFSTDCSAVKDRPMLCDGKTRANMNAFRIEKKYEGQGHISKLVKMAEQYAKNPISYSTFYNYARKLWRENEWKCNLGEYIDAKKQR